MNHLLKLGADEIGTKYGLGQKEVSLLLKCSTGMAEALMPLVQTRPLGVLVRPEDVAVRIRQMLLQDPVTDSLADFLRMTVGHTSIMRNREIDTSVLLVISVPGLGMLVGPVEIDPTEMPVGGCPGNGPLDVWHPLYPHQARCICVALGRPSTECLWCHGTEVAPTLFGLRRQPKGLN